MGGQQGRLARRPPNNKVWSADIEPNFGNISETTSILNISTGIDDVPSSPSSSITLKSGDAVDTKLDLVVDMIAKFSGKFDVQCLAFCDVNRLAIGVASGVVVYDWRTGRCITRSPLVAQSAAQCFGLCPVMQTSLCGLKDGSVLFSKYCTEMEMGPQTPTKTLKGHSCAVTAIAMSPEGRIGVSASDYVQVWRLEEHTAMEEQPALASFGVDSVANFDGSCQTSQLRGYKVSTFPIASQPVTCVAASSQGFAVSAGFSDGRINVWSTKCGDTASAFIFAMHKRAKACSAYKLDTKSLRTILQGYLPCSRQYGLLQMLHHRHTDAVCALTFTPTGSGMLSAGRDNLLHIWDLISGDATMIHADSPIHSICVSHDGAIALCGSSTQLYICCVAQGVLLRSVPMDMSLSLCMSADSRYLAVASKRIPGVQVTVWKIATCGSTLPGSPTLS